MKNIIRTTLAAILILAMCVTLCSCNIFKTMRENALAASLIEILDTPDENAVVAALGKYIDNSFANCISANESIGYSAGNPDINGEEKAGLLEDSAKQIRNFIMNGNPGSASRDVTADDAGLLEKFDAASALKINMNRNLATERVTDEKGNVLTDDNNVEVTTMVVSDNTLHLVLDYFDTEVVESVTKEDGTSEDTTVISGLDAATVASVFGEEADKEAVLKEFEAAADYLKLNDYSIQYTDCRVSSDMLLNEELVNFVRFEKNMDVTAKVTGVGTLASYGDFTVTFRLTKTVNYSFGYAAE